MIKKETSLVFFGTPQMAVWALEEMQTASIVPDLIITAPSAPAGRGRIITPPPVKTWADENGIKVIQPDKLNKKFTQELNLALEIPLDTSSTKSKKLLFLVFAYGKMLPKNILDIPKFGTLNIHPSMLPKLRGPSPIRTALLQDKPENVGVSIILLDEGMDHGPIVAQKCVKPLTWPLSGKELDELLARNGGSLLAQTIPNWLEGKIKPHEQKHNKATLSKLFKKEDALINFNDDDYKNYLKICAYDGWPGAYFFEDGKRIKITKAHIEGNKLIIDKVIPEGKKETTYQGATFS